MDNTLNKTLDDLKKVNQINNEIIKQQLEDIKKLRDKSKQDSKNKSTDSDGALQRFTDWWFGEDSSKKDKVSPNAKTKTLDDIFKAISDFSQNINEHITPILKDQLGLLQKISQDITISRKVNEGSLEYDSNSAQYRNLSGREIESEVSGKTIKKGGYVDFETASSTLSGQSKAVIERSKKKELKNYAPVDRKSPVIPIAYNQSTPEVELKTISETTSENLNVTNQIKNLNKDQVKELKKITELLTSIESSADSGIGGLLTPLGPPGTKDTKPNKGGAGSKLSRFLKGRGGMLAGGALTALTVGAGLYTAYEGFTGAESEKVQNISQIDAALKAGALTQEEADKKKKEISATATEKKGGAIGEGAGMAAGAITGAQAGAALGTMIGPPVVGTFVGAAAGGALGAVAGTEAGREIGKFGGKVVTGIENAPESIKKYDEIFAEVDKNKGFKPKESLPGTTAAEMINAGVWSDYMPAITGEAVEPVKSTVKVNEPISGKVNPIKPIIDRRPAADIVGSTKSYEGMMIARESTENVDLLRGRSMATGNTPIVVNNNSAQPSGQTFSAITPAPRNDDPLGNYFLNRKAAIAAFL